MLASCEENEINFVLLVFAEVFHREPQHIYEHFELFTFLTLKSFVL